jgi:hypothetical protein
MWGNIYPYFVITHLDGKGAHIVGELVKGAAAFQIEAGVMPVAGEDTILHRASVQGETHMRTAIVNGIDLALMGEEGDDMAV